MRNYDVLDDEGGILARASSCWLVLDVEKRRPLRPTALAVAMPLNEGRVFLDGGARSLPKTDCPVKLAERTAHYSDIDFNGHVNNVRYVEWVQDALPKDFIKNVTRLRIDMNYVSEVAPGESVGIYAPAAETAQRTFALEGRRLRDNQTAFRAGIEI
jgi:acyl-ACP thioesterase